MVTFSGFVEEKKGAHDVQATTRLQPVTTRMSQSAQTATRDTVQRTKAVLNTKRLSLWSKWRHHKTFPTLQRQGDKDPWNQPYHYVVR